ncbi:MAG: hypothetical protein KBH99_00800 [Syntrophobacteraceae bacterium]|nr:hypothetical protein [Syntrophobacteraceae bacterium]
MSRRQPFLVSILMIAFLLLLSFAFHHLHNAPVLGITTAWSQADHRYHVLTSSPWSPLKPGDVILRMGDLDVGFTHLLTDNIYIHGKNELFEWLRIKKDVFRTLMNPPVPFIVERDGRIVQVFTTPRKAGLEFLAHLEVLHLFAGIVFFLVGTIVFYKQKASEQGIVFFGMCMFLMLVFVTNATSLMSEIVYDPVYLAVNNISNIISLLLGNAFVLHLSLLIPRKRRFLDRFPALAYLFYALNVLVAASLDIRIINFLLALYGPLAALAVVQAFFTYRQPIERQQMRWIGVGFVFGLAPWVVINAIPMLVTGDRLMKDTIPAAFVVCIPVSMAFAIQKYRLLDIDAFLEGAYVYTITLLLLSIADLTFMGLLASHFSRSMDMSPAVQGLLSVALAIALYAALRDRVRFLVRKLFKRTRLDEATVLASFVEQAGGLSPTAAMKAFSDAVHEAFRPDKILTVHREDPDARDFVKPFQGELGPVNLWESSFEARLPDNDLYVALPVGKGEEVHHVLLLGGLPGGRFYSRHDMAVLKTLLTQARMTYENALLYEENLKHHHDRLAEARRHMREKEKMVKDLHDGIGGITTNISLLAELALQKQSLDEVRETLATISSLSRESLSEIRGFMQSLDPNEADWEALTCELRHLGSTMIHAHRMGFEICSSCDLLDEKPGSLLFLNVFRIYREALTNLIKHSRARVVKVVFTATREKLVLSVHDDGIGLERSEGRGTGRGISNMKARAEEVGGRLQVVSDHGTRVLLEVPLPVNHSPGDKEPEMLTQGVGQACIYEDRHR